MTSIRLTGVVDMDEPAVRLAEMNLTSDEWGEPHRVQTVYLIRGEELVEFKKDLGPTRGFTRDEFAIQCGFKKDNDAWESTDTVGRVMEQAEENRQFQNIQREEDPPDFRMMWWDENERRRLEAAHRSQFGAAHKKER